MIISSALLTWIHTRKPKKALWLQALLYVSLNNTRFQTHNYEFRFIVRTKKMIYTSINFFNKDLASTLK